MRQMSKKGGSPTLEGAEDRKKRRRLPPLRPAKKRRYCRRGASQSPRSGWVAGLPLHCGAALTNQLIGSKLRHVAGVSGHSLRSDTPRLLLCFLPFPAGCSFIFPAASFSCFPPPRLSLAAPDELPPCNRVSATSPKRPLAWLGHGLASSFDLCSWAAGTYTRPLYGSQIDERRPCQTRMRGLCLCLRFYLLFSS